MTSKFHDLRDERGWTIVIIEEYSCGNIFGVYTPITRSSDRKYHTDKWESFLFVLRDETEFEISNIDLDFDDDKEVLHDKGYGPIFDSGYDMCIYDRCNIESGSYY